MREWHAEVREAVGRLGMPREREAEVIEEVAQHLSGRYEDALARGASLEEATRSALEELETWADAPADPDRSRLSSAGGAHRAGRPARQRVSRRVRRARLLHAAARAAGLAARRDRGGRIQRPSPGLPRAAGLPGRRRRRRSGGAGRGGPELGDGPLFRGRGHRRRPRPWADGGRPRGLAPRRPGERVHGPPGVAGPRCDRPPAPPGRRQRALAHRRGHREGRERRRAAGRDARPHVHDAGTGGRRGGRGLDRGPAPLAEHRPAHGRRPGVAGGGGAAGRARDRPPAGRRPHPPLEEDVRAVTAPQRASAFVLAGFALAAVLLAAVGIYGVLAYAVAQQTREIGVRMAMGAGAADVLKMVGACGLRLAGTGMALGLAGALAVTRLLESLLHGVTPTDPATFAAVGLALGAVAAAACHIPARRAMRIDPLFALRDE